jgi:holo-[acyl-carrier protein] synthase
MNCIFGIGTDIVDISRIKIALNKNKRLKKKIYSFNEIKSVETKFNKIANYAKKFAAKEAFSKALGTGFSKGISFNEISINNNIHGKPYIELSGKTKLTVSRYLKRKYKIFLSISDEKKYALAMVVISY